LSRSSVEKLLLVADPQLIGEKDEGLFGLITRNDADRYLAKTFSQANEYIKPDWILFLGDIFDEGLSATDDEFKRYFDRFDSIFQYENREQKCIVIPGDNDVGGEYYGDKQPILRQRFRNYFGRTIALFRQNDIEYLKVFFLFGKFFVLEKNRFILVRY
jgi:metallophosphoesterase superfamily enzyme